MTPIEVTQNLFARFGEGDVEGILAWLHPEVTLDFYGTSFVCNHRAEVIADAGRDVEGMALATLDLDLMAKDRAQWGTFQTRQPRNYEVLVETPAGPPPS